MADKSKWSTKNILWYARTHGFAPDVAYSIFIDNKFNIKQLLLEKESRDIKKEKKFILTSEDEKINVTEIVTGNFLLEYYKNYLMYLNFQMTQQRELMKSLILKLWKKTITNYAIHL